MKSLIILLFIITSCIANAQVTPIGTVDDYQYRLLFIRLNFNNTSEVDAYIDIMERAANACYNGISLSDNQFNYLDIVSSPTIYFDNLQRFLTEAKASNLSVIPHSPTPQGFSLVQHNPNLAEGLPVKNAPFVVANQGGELVLVNDPNDTFPLLNGNFEATENGNEFAHWSTNNAWNNAIFRDTSEKHSGTASLRFTDPSNYGAGHIDIQQCVQVEPFRDYHISVWIKTENYTNPDGIGIGVTNSCSGGSRRQLQRNNKLDIIATQDWEKYDFTFNTLDSDEVKVGLRHWNGGMGDLWWDDLTIEPTRFNNIIRREDESVPVVINHEKNDTLQDLQEDIHIEKIVDPELGSIWHEQPLIKIIDVNNVLQGDKVFVSYYHSAFINNNPSGPSLAHPDLFVLTDAQLNLVRNEWLIEDIFEGWFFGHDEIRLHNWEEDPPGYTLGTPAENLEYNFNTIYDQAKSIDINAKIMVWSDMFDPTHNAKSEEESNHPYYLVNGYWGRDDGETGIPSDVIIMNWRNEEGVRIESCEFFAENGHSQILCTNDADEDDVFSDEWWQELQIANVPNIKGVMYTTWYNNYDMVEEWAELMWGGCAGDCEDFENVTGTVNQNIDIGAQIQLTSNATIASDKQVKFMAGNNVKLEAGFKFDSNGTGTFKATRGNCPE